MPVLGYNYLRSALCVLWVILSTASANFPNLSVLLFGKKKRSLHPNTWALVSEWSWLWAVGMAHATGMNSIWLRGNPAPGVFSSHLCKQHMFCLHQRELRHEVMLQLYFPYCMTTRRHFQKCSHSITLMTGTVCIIHKLPPSKLRDPADEGACSPCWHQKCVLHGLFGSFPSSHQSVYSGGSGDW